MSMTSFIDLTSRYFVDGADPNVIEAVSLSQVITAGHDPQHILAYLGSLGVHVRTLDDLELGLQGLENEEELSAHRVAEGVAVGHASDGWWVLFVP